MCVTVSPLLTGSELSTLEKKSELASDGVADLL